VARIRKQFLVERKVQLTLGLRIVAQWFIFLAVSLVVTTFLYMPSNLEQTLWQDFKTAVLSQLPSITVFLALLPWFIHDSLKLSNRFAGPMVRLRTAIIHLTQGEDSPALAFRKGDYWTDMASEFNKLRERVLDERAQLNQGREAQVETRAEAVSARDTDEDTLPLASLPVATSYVAASAPVGQ
jgi:hypothetical protein